MRSLDQQDAARTWDEQALLDLSIAKGGASVLTDACLVRGSLTEDEAEFMFAYGVVLQLMDDLQDLSDDLSNGHMTIFTRQARLGTLDELTSRSCGYSRDKCSVVSAGWPLARICLRQGSDTGQSEAHCSCKALPDTGHITQRPLLMRLEDSSPVRFCYLARQEKTLAGRYSQGAGYHSARHRRLDSVFEILE